MSDDDHIIRQQSDDKYAFDIQCRIEERGTAALFAEAFDYCPFCGGELA